MFVNCPQAAGAGTEKQFGLPALTFLHNQVLKTQDELQMQMQYSNDRSTRPAV